LIEFFSIEIDQSIGRQTENPPQIPVFVTGAPGIPPKPKDRSTSDGPRRGAHPPKRPSTQGYSGHSRLVLSLLQLLFPSLFPLVTLTAVAANIPIRRRRVLKSREAPRRADKNPQITSRALQFSASQTQRFEPPAAAAVGSWHGGDSQVRHVQPGARYARVRLSVSIAAELIRMPPWKLLLGI